MTYTEHRLYHPIFEANGQTVCPLKQKPFSAAALYTANNALTALSYQAVRRLGSCFARSDLISPWCIDST